jgi:hypothetical protein
VRGLRCSTISAAASTPADRLIFAQLQIRVVSAGWQLQSLFFEINSLIPGKIPCSVLQGIWL